MLAVFFDQDIFAPIEVVEDRFGFALECIISFDPGAIDINPGKNRAPGDHREENKVADSRSNPGCLRIFVLPHMIAGAFIFYLCVMMVAPEVAGTSCVGTAHKESKKNKTSSSFSDSEDGPALEVTFKANGKTYTVNPRVEYSFYSTVADGGAVPVKYWSLAPEQSAFVDYPGNKHFKWFLIIFS